MRGNLPAAMCLLYFTIIYFIVVKLNHSLNDWKYIFAVILYRNLKGAVQYCQKEGL